MDIEKAHQTSFTSLCWAFTIFFYKNILTAWGTVFQNLRESEPLGTAPAHCMASKTPPKLADGNFWETFPINGDGRWRNSSCWAECYAHDMAPKIQFHRVFTIQSIQSKLYHTWQFHHETQRTPICMFPVLFFLFCFGKYITLLWQLATGMRWRLGLSQAMLSPGGFLNQGGRSHFVGWMGYFI